MSLTVGKSAREIEDIVMGELTSGPQEFVTRYSKGKIPDIIRDLIFERDQAALKEIQ